MSMVSATILGREIGGLNSREVNMLLSEEGYLSGEPGDWTVTPKGIPYSKERDYHRGNGGYDYYNRYWTERKWDPQILDEIGEILPERKVDLSRKIKEYKQQKQAERISIDEYNRLNNLNTSANGYPKTSTENSSINPLVILNVAIAVIGVYEGIRFAAPRVKKWWQETAHPTILAVKETLAYLNQTVVTMSLKKKLKANFSCQRSSMLILCMWPKEK